MYHPLNGLACRRSPSDAVTSNDVFIPGGTDVGVSEYGMLRRTDFFGADADTIRPERWIEETDTERLQMDERIWELVFGGDGRSSCLGKNIALMELSKVIFTVCFPLFLLYCTHEELADGIDLNCYDTTTSRSSTRLTLCRPTVM